MAVEAPSIARAAPARRPMVIGQICHGALGGSSRMACRLANALSRRGHEVHLFSRYELPWSLERRIGLHPSGAGGLDIEAPLYWDWTEADRVQFADRLTAALRARTFDVLHYHYAHPFAELLGGIAASLGAAMPFVVGTLHGTDLTLSLRDPAALAAIGRVLATTDAVTTVSEHMRRLAGALPGARPAARVLPNFVEDSWPDIAGRSPATRLPTILHVSNFRTVKDVGLLARLFIAIHERTGAALCLVGDGPEMPALRRLLDASPAAAAVRYVGACARPEGHFREASLLLSTSVEESFGLAILEAMASGLPVAATAVGGIPELVDDDVTGLLFQAADFDRTVSRIVALLRVPERLGAFRAASLARAATLRESCVIARYEDLYRERPRGLASRPAG